MLKTGKRRLRFKVNKMNEGYIKVPDCFWPWLSTSSSPGFKWFGSLTNLSIRRPPQKTKIKAVPEHSGSHAGLEDGAADDMEACPRSYACSSLMYTHVGTVPRSEKQRSCNKKKKKKETREEEDGGVRGEQSQWRAGEHVPNSPLLSALSSLSLGSLDRPVPGSPATRPQLSRASPLTSTAPPGDLTRSRDASGTDTSVTLSPDMATNACRAAPAQDVYMPMDRRAEAARSPTDGQTEQQRGETGEQETGRTANRWETLFITPQNLLTAKG